ncbi:outer membrane protein TolC [Tenacibaculum adriaticum]|uniref:Outer membrane protein TolC n=1 Tax=Tenacibaculum adriaticum TaxID=413713 RepID=A0A5S5DW39_9FLAO|nr:TolC family protein [Tenacibaculum adriaticum]TYQ00062.1 outer membrane protein TolC [Tenacibaculum adriaticum]
MKFINKYICIGAVLFSFQLVAQNTLTKKEALKITLENNYGIKIANNNIKVAKNNSSIYNSGYLPTISATSGANYSNTNQTVVRQDTTISINGAVTKSYNASVGLNYTIFDGLGRKYNYDQLKERYDLSELQARETIENTYLQLFTVYFQIARLSENTSSLQEALKISKQRLKRAEYQYEYGQSTKLELLNAEVDVNNDSIAFINSKQQFANAKRSLNIILGVSKEVGYDVETEVSFSTLLNLDDLLSEAKSNNVLLKQNEKNIAINEFNIKVNKANYLPSLGLTTSYGWNKSENPATSFATGSTSDGLSAGLNLSWNLFDGGSTKTRVANAKIALENQEILLEQQEETLENNLKNTWEDYQNKLFVSRAQEQNVITSQNNFDRTEERYKLGQVSSIEFRQAQINLINTKTALNNAKFDAKLIELQLLQLSGQILNTEF